MCVRKLQPSLRALLMTFISIVILFYFANMYNSTYFLRWEDEDADRHMCIAGMCIPFIRKGMTEIEMDNIRDDIFKKRRSTFQNTCKLYYNGERRRNFRDIKGRNLLYNAEHRFVYCMVEKVGCTFWRRIFYLLNHPENTSVSVNPFTVPHYFVHTKSLLPTLGKYNDTETSNILKTSTSVMFVREPYERAFSGYVDKLFSLNSFYWSTVGRSAIRLVRKNATRLSLQCGHDLTFKEFIQYLVIQDKRRGWIDIHFSSMHSHCHPCGINVTYIGKMETFNADAKYLIKTLNLFGNAQLENLRKGTLVDNIKLVLEDTLGSGKSLNRCLTSHQMIERAWDTLKFRGLIHPEAPLPQVNPDTVDVSSLLKIATQFSHEARVSEYKRKQVIRLYQTVDDDLIEQFRKFILLDSKLFGYEDRPNDIFSSRKLYTQHTSI